ncbi:MAG: hypothetical protein NVSMB19_10280 [Vulcanimicrobiaceae bacterium]
MKTPVRLLPREELLKTGDVDHAAWNYTGILGFVSRQRFELVSGLLPQRVGTLLEIGYGSGIFMPELARRAEHLFGVDVHDRAAEAMAVLQRNGVAATLSQATAEALPFPDASFDAVVVVSTFEFVADIERAARELGRVLRPGGTAVVVTPVDHPLLDLALRIATGESAKKDFGDRRKRIVPTLVRELRHERSAWFPSASPLPVYRALRLTTASPAQRVPAPVDAMPLAG